MFKKQLPIIFIGLCVVVAVLVLSWAVFVKTETVVPVQVPVVDDEVVSDDNNALKIDDFDWKTYQTTEPNIFYQKTDALFEIKHPKDWSLVETKVSLDIYSFQSTIGYSIGALPENQFKVEIWRWDSLNNPKSSDILSWCDKELDNYNSSSQKRIFSRQKKVINNFDVAEIEFELEKDKRINGKFVCFTGEKNNIVILGHPLKSKYMKVFDQILSTIKFINP